jgi:hypothetical protein
MDTTALDADKLLKLRSIALDGKKANEDEAKRDEETLLTLRAYTGDIAPLDETEQVKLLLNFYKLSLRGG